MESLVDASDAAFALWRGKGLSRGSGHAAVKETPIRVDARSSRKFSRELH